MRRDPAFTLTELLVTLAILASVLAAVMVSYRSTLSQSEYDKGLMHAQSVRLAINTALAANPHLTTATLGNVNCTGAADIGPSGVTSANGNNGWEAAPAGTVCWATPHNSRTVRVTVYYPDGKVVTTP
jgi:type IV pilus assembly protein PilA